MVICALTIISLLASTVYGQQVDTEPSAYDHEYIKNTKRAIEGGLKLDRNKEPFFESDSFSDYPCYWPFNINCGTAYYHVRNELYKTSNITAWPKLEVVPGSRVETASNPGPLTVSETHTVTTTTTEGWSVGVTFAANLFGQYGSVGGSVSRETSGSTSKANTASVELTKGSTCPPYHHCHLQIWTWHVNIKGVCSMEPKINCGGNVPNVCEQTCHDRRGFKSQFCEEPVSDSNGYRQLRPLRDKDCEVTSPVIENGKTMSKVQVVERPIRPRVIRWETHDIADLHIGQKWNPGLNLYYSKDRGEWFARPDVPKPYISPEMDKARPAAPAPSEPEGAGTEEEVKNASPAATASSEPKGTEGEVKNASPAATASSEPKDTEEEVKDASPTATASSEPEGTGTEEEEGEWEAVPSE